MRTKTARKKWPREILGVSLLLSRASRLTSAHGTFFSETCCTIFRVEPPRVLKGVNESWGGGRGRGGGNKLTFSIASQRRYHKRNISFDLLLAFHLLKNDGAVTPNQPINFVPTSCVVLMRRHPYHHMDHYSVKVGETTNSNTLLPFPTLPSPSLLYVTVTCDMSRCFHSLLC